MTRKAILVVEDDPAIAEIVTLALSDNPDYRARSVGDGVAALARVVDDGADLVLLDINLPGLDGFQVHDALRGDPETEVIPVLFMTAGRHEAEFARRGVRDWLPKPFDLADLVDRVDLLLAAPGGTADR